MARLGFFGRIAKAIGQAGDAIADVFKPDGPGRASRRRDSEAKAFRRGQRTSGKAAERYAQQRRDAEATRKANAKRRRDAAKKGQKGPPQARSDYQERRRQAEEAERRARRDRQRARERDPYLASWNTLTNRPGYLDHRDFFGNHIMEGLDLDPEEELELWQAYITYMTQSNNAFRLNSLDNPFWNISNIHPDNFDWYNWREAMGYDHGKRGR